MAGAPALTAIRAATVAVVIVAIVAQGAVLVGEGAFNPTRFFAFFTIQSNLIGVAAFVLLLLHRRPGRPRWLESLRGAAAVYLTVTFFVVIFLLSGVDVQLQLGWVDFVLHKLFPVVFVADYLLDPPRSKLTLRDAALWLVYPIVWVALTLVRGTIDGWYPYPFLDPANGGYGAVAVTVVAITVGFLVISAIHVWLGNARRPHGPESRPAT